MYTFSPQKRMLLPALLLLLLLEKLLLRELLLLWLLGSDVRRRDRRLCSSGCSCCCCCCCRRRGPPHPRVLRHRGPPLISFSRQNSRAPRCRGPFCVCCQGPLHEGAPEWGLGVLGGRGCGEEGFSLLLLLLQCRAGAPGRSSNATCCCWYTPLQQHPLACINKGLQMP